MARTPTVYTFALATSAPLKTFPFESDLLNLLELCQNSLIIYHARCSSLFFIASLTFVTFSNSQQPPRTARQFQVCVDLVSVDDPDTVLHEIKKRVTRDFIIIRGDLFLTGHLHALADVHRVKGSKLTLLLKEQAVDAAAQKRRLKKDAGNVDMFGLDDEG